MSTETLNLETITTDAFLEWQNLPARLGTYHGNWEAWHQAIAWERDRVARSEIPVNAEREKVAAWMIRNGFSTGHGDTTEDLLSELEEQTDELRHKLLLKRLSERESVAHKSFDREALIELACRAAWRRDYPVGGSCYKTYDSLPYHDHELYRKEVEPIVDAFADAGKPINAPYLHNRADGVDGHYCIARHNPKGFTEFYEAGKWVSATSLIFYLGKINQIEGQKP